MAMSDVQIAANREWICRIGEALFGPSWQTPLGNALGVTPRTVRYWASGSRAVNDGARQDIHTLLQDRAAQCLALAREIAGDEKSHAG